MKKKIVFFGDSNTYGYDPRGMFGGRYPAHVRWADRLAKEMAGDWEIVPCGLNGRCIPAGERAYEYVDLMLQNAGRIDVFAVMLGTNDVVLTMRPDAEAAVRRMDALLDHLKKKGWPFEILLIAPAAMAEVHPGPEGCGADPAAEEQADEFGRYVRETRKLPARYRELAEKYAVRFADADSWNIPMAYDYTHFSEEGHRIFAERMARFMREQLMP